jgi:triosephosphate isomerase
MRKPLIAGNWKMNKTIDEAVSLVNTIKSGVHHVNGVDIVVCPPFTALSAVNEALDRSNVGLGAQNMYSETDGAFTGEVSPLMIKDIGCRYVILGHSERRSIFKETDAVINAKVKTALQYNLIPIVCVGETLEEREKGAAKDVVRKQMQESLKGLSKDDMQNVVIAYEPVWAIGTGKTATPAQAEEVHRFIRQLLNQSFDATVSESVRILYGGSMKPENVAELMKQENIDGGLIGGAALKGESFIQLVTLTKEVLESSN